MNGMTLTDTIVRPGQQVGVQLTRGNGARPKQLYLHHHLYEGEGRVPRPEPVAIQWQENAGLAVFQLPELGNYALTIGKDDLAICRRPVGARDPEPPRTPYRNLACVGPESTVIRQMVAASGNPF